MKSPLITIITTSYERAGLLEKTMKSVLAENYPFVEHLIVDGGSKDGTVDLLKRYEPIYKKKGYIFRWVSQKDSGQGEAMNKGLKIATGEVLNIMNSDDFFVPGAIERAMRVFVADPSIDIVYGAIETTFADSPKKQLTRYKTYNLESCLYYGYQIPQPSCFFKKSLVEKVGGFDESLHHVAEHDLFLRFLKIGAKAFYIDEPIAVMLEHVGRKTLAYPERCLNETKMVNFRYGGSPFSPFYALYLKEKYFGGLFRFLEKHAPGIFSGLKKAFYKIT